MKILVIGDSCIDKFIYGDIERIAPEAPVPVIKPERFTENPGMAANVAANLEALGANVNLYTNDTKIKKIRYVDNRSNQMVLRVDENDNCERIDILQWHLDEYNAIVISDYCKGFLTSYDIAHISKIAKCPVFLDTKKQLGEWCSQIDYIKINDLEHRKNFETIPNYPMLQDKLIVTQGPKGCLYKEKIYPVQVVPVKDVSGAGDTFIAGLVYEYVKSNNIEKTINFAQECTTSVVQKPGVATIKN